MTSDTSLTWPKFFLAAVLAIGLSGSSYLAHRLPETRRQGPRWRSAASTAACRARSSTAGGRSKTTGSTPSGSDPEAWTRRSSSRSRPGARDSRSSPSSTRCTRRDYLKDHPDAAPVGPDGERMPRARRLAGRLPDPSGLPPQPDGGISPDAPRGTDRWDLARLPSCPRELGAGPPELPDTCFCPRCLAQFQKDTAVILPVSPTRELSRRLLGPERASWVGWRCDVFTDWVREFREILDRERPVGAARHVPLPMDRYRARRGPPRQAGHRPEGPGPLPRRPESHALPRAVRPRGRSGVDLAADRLAGPASGHRGQAGGADSGSGRSSSSRTGESPCHRPRSARCSTTAPGHRRRASWRSSGAHFTRNGTRWKKWGSSIDRSNPDDRDLTRGGA